MKVLISRPKPWFGPYQLAEALCWWAKSERDEYGFRSKPEWVHRFGEWLAYGSIEPAHKTGERYRLGGRNRKPTYLYNLLIWLNKLYPRVEYVKIDWWDDYRTLGTVILAFLYCVKQTKQGAPWTDNEDVPEHLHRTIDETDTDEHWFARWDYILDKMIYSFEQIQQDWEAKHFKGESDIWFERQEDGSSLMVRGDKDTSWIDEEGLKQEDERIQQGLYLFGKYYRNLWN